MSYRAPAITLIYAAFAALWIVLSATVLDIAVNDAILHDRIELTKGLAFVAVTSALLYFLLRRRERTDTDTGGALPLPLLASLFLAVPLLGLAVYALHSRQQLTEVQENLDVLARLKAEQIERWLAERRGDGTTLTASAGFIARIADIRRTGSPADIGIASALLESYRTSYGYDSIEVFDDAGRRLFGVGPARVPMHSTPALMQQALAAREVRMGDIERGADGTQCINFVAPLLQSGVRVAPQAVGYVVLHMDPARVLYPQLTIWPDARDTGRIHLVRRDGDSALFLNATDDRIRAGAQRYPLAEAARPGAAAVLAPGSGVLRGKDFRGVEVLAAFHPVAGTGWKVLVRIDRAEAIASARNLAAWVSAVTLFAVLIAGVVLGLLWRARRHADRLAMQAETEHLFRRFYTLPFIGMAVTSPETKRWVQFNDRLCEIFGYPREELAQKTWTELTHPDDLDKDVAEFDRVMHGETNGYAMDKRFIRKDGVIVHATIDVRCHRRPDGSIDQFFATVQDITERKASEARIQTLNRYYHTLSLCNEAIARERSEDELFRSICRIAVETAGLKLAWIGRVDDASGRVIPVASHGPGADYLDGIRISVSADDPHGRGPTGTSIRENRPYWCEDFLRDPNTAPWHEKAQHFHWGASAALPLLLRGRPVAALTIYAGAPDAFDAEIQGLLVRMANNLGLAMDARLLEREHDAAIESLRESEERYRLVLAHSLDAIFVTAPDGRILSANAAACRMLMRSEEEICRLGRTGVVELPDPRVDDFARRRRETGSARGEMRMIRSDGTRIDVEVTSAIFRDRNGEERTSMIVRDASERKRAEAQIAAQLDELRRWHAAMLGREERVLELKREINEVLRKASAPPRYPSAEAQPENEGMP